MLCPCEAASISAQPLNALAAMHYMYINYCTYPSPLLYIIVHTLVHYCTLIIVHTLVHCCTLIIVHTLVHYLTQAPRVCICSLTMEALVLCPFLFFPLQQCC